LNGIEWQARVTNQRFGGRPVWNAEYRLVGGPPQFVRDADGLPYRFMSEIEAAGAARAAGERALEEVMEALRRRADVVVHRVSGTAYREERRAQQYLERIKESLFGTVANIVVAQDGLYLPCAIVHHTQTDLITGLVAKGIGVILT
jgi:hypothetical protein